MLDHHEERQLADIEAHLRDEAPDLLELFDEIPDIADPVELTPTQPQGGHEPIERETIGHTGHTTTHPVLKSIVALVAAVALTTLVTLTVGPDLGGLVAVVGFSIAGMYAYQVLCPACAIAITTPEAGSPQPNPQEIGVGPWIGPVPDDPRLDPDLVRDGDRRNVADRYRYWSNAAIVADLDTRRHPFHVAIENWQHDMNIGTVVRNANAFLAAGVHIVGRRRWNRRGAMVTDRYQHVQHHPTIEDLATWAAEQDLPLIGIDNLPGSVPIETVVLPRRCVLVLGQEGPGLSDGCREALEMTCSIAQFGSTRSINAGVASGIAMHTWIRQHADLPA